MKDQPSVPAARFGEPAKVAPITLFTLALFLIALLTVRGPFEGVLSNLPSPLARMLHTMALAVSGGIFLLCARWHLQQRFERRRPVVAFDAEHMVVRTFDPPFGWSVNRADVRSVHLRELGQIGGAWLRFGPLVVVDMADGTSRRLPPYFAGQPTDLATDIAGWAHVTVACGEGRNSPSEL